eukprot:344471_1
MKRHHKTKQKKLQSHDQIYDSSECNQLSSEHMVHHKHLYDHSCRILLPKSKKESPSKGKEPCTDQPLNYITNSNTSASQAHAQQAHGVAKEMQCHRSIQ